MKQEHGIFTISLDFELYWGVRDKRSIEQYGENLRGVRSAIREMLKTFNTNGIHATWATVGFLFFKDAAELKKYLPECLPNYKLEKLSPYVYLATTENLDAECHFAPDMVDLIAQHKGQEIGTHTFSHYYCLESGQSLAEFRDDLKAAVTVAKSRGLSVNSLVFPRNQWNKDYLAILDELGVSCYRGNEASWIYKASDNEGQGKLQRLVRLLDSYVNLSGHHTHELSHCLATAPCNIPASRFLRPYSKRLAVLDDLRLKRITKSMEDAAINKRIFHLWWHPHNFGKNTEQNIVFLNKIIDHYKVLQEKYDMKSLNMGELALLKGIVNG
jgi:peptidoglycan/xylan/chitin deacetylase (PgdA/CDA1 family)